MDNMAMKRKKYRSTLLYATACMILAVLAFFGSTVAAKWISTGSGSDSAAVALFAVDAQAISDGDLSIDCGADVKSANYQFMVTNQKDGNISQVSFGYDVKVVLPSVLPEGVAMAIDGVPGTKSVDGMIYTFSCEDWFFAAGADGSKTHALAIAADPDVLEADVSISEITISLVASQLD